MEVCGLSLHIMRIQETLLILFRRKVCCIKFEGMKLDLAQRIVDSVSGGCYAIQEIFRR